MSTDPAGTPLAEHWSRAVDAAGALIRAVHAVQEDEAAAVALLEAQLRSASARQIALFVLGTMRTGFTVALADLLIEASISHRDAVQVRQLFGRLPRHEIVEVVPPAVWRFVAQDADHDAYRRLAELLDHLAIDDALRLLCEVALDSDDEETREVGREYWPDGPRRA